jgi:succinate dehydrogenase/fumarate reductase flavoprotein subunit
MQIVETDVLVVGGGAAGAMAAYEASKHGVRVTVAVKGRIQRTGCTILAPGAIAGVGPWHVAGDSQDVHFADTVKGGSFLNEQNLVRILVRESPGHIVELERMGALWQREPDGATYSLRIDGGHSYHRCPFLEDRTGREMMRTLAGALQQRHVQVLEDTMALSVLLDEERAAGILAMDMSSQEPVLLKAKAVILACGGAGNLYLNTSNPMGITGDGYALAAAAGAAMMDMEFVQFYPLGFLYPRSLRGILGALLYYVRLLNSRGERFMERYDPGRKELSTRDRVARAMFTEVKEGRGGHHGGVFADMTYHPPGYLQEMQPALHETYQKIGVDPSRDYLEVAPTCHFIMGGVRVDENWQTTVPGLFAAGETAAGVHGANRLSQNALAEVLVSGARAGAAAAHHARDTARGRVDPLMAKKLFAPVEAVRNREKGVRPVHVRDRLKRLMWSKVGVFRTGVQLKEALGEIECLTGDLAGQYLALKSRRHNHELVISLENRSLLLSARCTVASALARTESRGAHFRADYPEQDNRNWLRHVVVTLDQDSLKVETAPVRLDEIHPGE